MDNKQRLYKIYKILLRGGGVNPITGKEIRINPGSIVHIDEFCNMVSSHYYCAYNSGGKHLNYVIKFDSEYKNIANQFPELYINKYNECLLFVSNNGSYLNGSVKLNTNEIRNYSMHMPLGIYTIPQYVITLCFCYTWYHVKNTKIVKYYSGIAHTIISCMHYPWPNNCVENIENIMSNNVNNNLLSIHHYIFNKINYSMNDIVRLYLNRFNAANAMNCNTEITTFQKTQCYDVFNSPPVTTNWYKVKDKVAYNKYWNVMGNNEMIVMNDSNEDMLYLR